MPPVARGVASGGETGDKVHRAQRSRGPAIAYWPSGAPGQSIKLLGRKEGELPDIRRSFQITVHVKPHKAIGYMHTEAMKRGVHIAYYSKSAKQRKSMHWPAARQSRVGSVSRTCV